MDGQADNPSVLTVSGVTKRFGALTALNDVDLTVNDGDIVGLIGPNGAGKSTLFNCIMGTYNVNGGEIFLRDEPITGMRTSTIINQGIARTFQIPRIFPELTVRENLIIHQSHREESLMATAITRTSDDVQSRIDKLIDFVNLTHLSDELAYELSTGQQKLLNIITTLVPDPDLVLLDEPTAGVNPGLIEDIVETIVALNEQGMTFLIIEHNINAIRALSTYLYVLANGSNLTDGLPDETLEDPRVLEAYFGE